jgi:hypothetical protein
MINKKNIIKLEYSDGLSCPICKTRILPGDIDEYPEDTEIIENYSIPNYCEHVAYCVLDLSMIEYLSKEVKEQFEEADANESDFFDVVDLTNIVEYQIQSANQVNLIEQD